MRAIDAAYVRRERKRRADTTCDDCGGEGVVTFTASSRDGEVEVACPCLGAELEGAPDPLADETGFDARELAREFDR